MRFSWDFLQNMLENGHSNLQTNLWVHITLKYFQNIQFKNHGIAPTPPYLPTLKAYPTPGVGGRFGIFSLKWRERMNLKVPGAILPLGSAILSTRATTVRGGWYNPPPLRRTRVNQLWYNRQEMAITESKFCHVSISETSHHGNIAQYFCMIFGV